MKTHIHIAAILGAIAVMIGAFAAHGLKAKLNPESLAVFNTGVRYQMWHVLAILAAAALNSQLKDPWPRRAAFFFIAGIVLFSGSLYLLSTKSITNLNWPWLGPITPVGGLSFILGWVCLVIGTKKS